MGSHPTSLGCLRVRYSVWCISLVSWWYVSSIWHVLGHV